MKKDTATRTIGSPRDEGERLFINILKCFICVIYSFLDYTCSYRLSMDKPRLALATPTTTGVYEAFDARMIGDKVLMVTSREMSRTRTGGPLALVGRSAGRAGALNSLITKNKIAHRKLLHVPLHQQNIIPTKTTLTSSNPFFRT